MKLNTFKKGLLTSILIGTFALSINACGKKEDTQKNAVEEYRIKEKKYFNISLHLDPEEKAGQNLEIYAGTIDEGSYWNVKEIKLYEDDEVIATDKGNDEWPIECITKTVTHKEQGIHSYFAEVIYENGEIRKSETKQIEFTGELMGKKYAKINFNLYPETKTGQSLKIYAGAIDGDNYWNIREMRIYEDGKIIATDKGNDDFSIDCITKNVIHREPGIHSYFAEFLYENDGDKQAGGKKTTETKQVEFTGEILDMPPESVRISVCQNELFLQALDYGDHAGIVNVVVYEDGKAWKTICYPSDSFNTNFIETIPLDLEKTGKHEYYVEFTDHGRNAVKTETIIIDYD